MTPERGAAIQGRLAPPPRQKTETAASVVSAPYGNALPSVPWTTRAGGRGGAPTCLRGPLRICFARNRNFCFLALCVAAPAGASRPSLVVARAMALAARTAASRELRRSRIDASARGRVWSHALSAALYIASRAAPQKRQRDRLIPSPSRRRRLALSPRPEPTGQRAASRGCVLRRKCGGGRGAAETPIVVRPGGAD